ncbi:cytochrome C heme lyase, partial [Salmonella enterica subsp. enterica serovar Dublin]
GGLTRDPYAALGEELGNGAGAVRLHYKPFVRGIWARGLQVVLDGLLRLVDPSYRRRKPLPEPG